MNTPANKPKPLHLPNLTLATKVTVLRVLGVPVFVLLLVYYTLNLSRGIDREFERQLALVLFLLIALTDALDGYLARSRSEITSLGRILDPLADKLLLLSGLILLTRPNIPALHPQFPISYTLLVISRDVILIAGAFVIHHTTGAVRVQPRWMGKVATVFQMTAIVWLLALWPTDGFYYVMGTAALFTFASGIQYLLDGMRQFEREH